MPKLKLNLNINISFSFGKACISLCYAAVMQKAEVTWRSYLIEILVISYQD